MLFMSGDEACGERADVGHRVEVRDLTGDRLRVALVEDARGAAEELVAELRVGERRVRMSGGAAWRFAEGPAVAEPNGHPAPRVVLLARVGERRVDDHSDARHQRGHAGIAHGTVL